MEGPKLISPSLHPDAFGYGPARPHVAKARGLVGDLNALGETLAADPTKTEAQRALDQRKWALPARSRGMDALVQGEEVIRRRIRELEATVAVSLRPGISALEQGEIRSAYRALDQKERARIRVGAIAAGDRRTVGSLVGAPEWLSGISAAESEMIRAEWKRLHFPDEMKEMEELEADLRKYPHAVAAFNKVFDEVIENPVAREAKAAAKRTAAALSK